MLFSPTDVVAPEDLSEDVELSPGSSGSGGRSFSVSAPSIGAGSS